MAVQRSSAQRKLNRAQSWKTGKERSELRRLENAEAASRNKALRKDGLPTPSDKWAPVKKRAAVARASRRQDRRESSWCALVGKPSQYMPKGSYDFRREIVK